MRRGFRSLSPGVELALWSRAGGRPRPLTGSRCRGAAPSPLSPISKGSSSGRQRPEPDTCPRLAPGATASGHLRQGPLTQNCTVSTSGGRKSGIRGHRATFPLRLQGRVPPVPSSSRGPRAPGLVAMSPQLLPLSSRGLHSVPSSGLCKGTCHGVRGPLISSSLTTSAETLSPRELTVCRFWGLGRGHAFCGGLSSAQPRPRNQMSGFPPFHLKATSSRGHAGALRECVPSPGPQCACPRGAVRAVRTLTRRPVRLLRRKTWG